LIVLKIDFSLVELICFLLDSGSTFDAHMSKDFGLVCRRVSSL